MDSARRTRLNHFLDSFCGEEAVPFSRFMEAALYHPEFGYYTGSVGDIGGLRADFATWPTRSAPGRAMGNWVKAETAHHGWRNAVHVIEVGGGDGSMARSLLGSMKWSERRKIRYHIVDISKPLVARQKRRLRRFRVHWHATIQEALAASDQQALVFSNELVDAFPAEWLRWGGRQWQTVMVRYRKNQGVSEEFQPSPIQPDFAAPEPGQRIEMHLSYLEWLKSWLPMWQKGSLLTIDYGGRSLAEIYYRKPAGTVRGFYRHQRIEGAGVYSRFGQQDLTCDVNFSDLVEWGKRDGLATVFLENQKDFIDRYDGTSPRDQAAAEAFLCLLQRRG